MDNSIGADEVILKLLRRWWMQDGALAPLQNQKIMLHVSTADYHWTDGSRKTIRCKQHNTFASYLCTISCRKLIPTGRSICGVHPTATSSL